MGEYRKTEQRHPSGGITPHTGSPGRTHTAPRGSVEAYWPPLTPEHGFPSLHFWPGHRALPLCPLPALSRGAAVFSSHVLSKRSVSGQTKTGRPNLGRPAMQSYDPYDFLRWHYPHQVRGSRRQASSQPAAASSPVCAVIIRPFCPRVKSGFLPGAPSVPGCP